MSDNIDPQTPSGTASPAKARSSIIDSSLAFLKIGGRTKDGQPQKKRGPKPDSRPAQNPRQARNRQAQRTHRERKERYVHNLEQEVVRLREAFTTTSREKSTIISENRRLRDILRANGITVDDLIRYASRPSSPENKNPNDLSDLQMTDQYQPDSPANTENYGSSAYSHAGTMSPEAQGQQMLPQQIPQLQSQQQMHQPSLQQPSAYGVGAGGDGNGMNFVPGVLPSEAAVGRMEQAIYPGNSGQQGINYSQIGIDFVLALEKPCMHHIMSLARATLNHPSHPTPHMHELTNQHKSPNTSPEHNLELDGHGHAMMTICPPTSFFLNGQFDTVPPLTPTSEPDTSSFIYPPLKPETEATPDLWMQTYTSTYLPGTTQTAQTQPLYPTSPDQATQFTAGGMDQADVDLLFNMQVLDAKRAQTLVDLKAEGELTPVAVWAWITTRPEFPMMVEKDFEVLKQALAGKVNCYGFGAVLDESYVEEAWENFLEYKGWKKTE
ncbi:hypothetical protein BJ508DRAFT_414764 [Ascobolus immersus RN42]|uniref:BZIP domain-containing protein n=1 Tax=Ascobolus immersus RN42 TaxID=1160509 RepID=A0A3N4I5F3_ASCIM|nr:hypothetical protein BJ508DRAFT_414764 [Ascobolus immersus RN42]